MVRKLFLALAFAAFSVFPHISALDFDASTWIWTNEVSGGNAPVGTRAFRKDFVAPLGKTPVQADIIMTADNTFTLYVNNVSVGGGEDFLFAERFCVPLYSCLNVFAVTATNTLTTPTPAGLLAAIEITYDDGTTSKIVSDTTWRYSISVPSGFEDLTFDDSSWPPAIAEGAYGVSPWGQIGIPSNPPVLSLTNADWIWTSEISGGNAPAGNRAFRRTYSPAPNQGPSTNATVIIVADNAYTLYVNGFLIGSGTDFHTAQTYNIALDPANETVFAVFTMNQAGVPTPAGLLAAIEVYTVGCNCTSGALLITDGTWKSNTGTPAGFELPGYDDSAWPAATIEAHFGVAPWGDVPVGGPGPATPIAGAPLGL
ncbi:lectin [Roridomyces roridus]|uniref:Lectin n=1 Tax=Roridomyces roridus TaxID=1738132 RepID=A0AAD7BVH4_9AGAR|nr:lectin [Roridomyces roridus]